MNPDLRELISILRSMLENGEEIPNDIIYRLEPLIERQIRTNILKKQASTVSSKIKQSDSQKLLWTLAGGDENAFINYLRNSPIPGMQDILRNPDLLENTIEDLTKNYPQNRDRTAQGVQESPLQSSNVWGFAYDPSERSLLVKFQGDGVYQYYGIPQSIFNALKSGSAEAKTTGSNQWGRWWMGKTPSIGAALSEYVKKSGFPYQKVA